MSEYIFYFIGIILSASISMKLSSKYEWSKNYWRKINLRFSESLNIGFWLAGSIIFQRAVDEVAQIFTSNGFVIKFLIGISLGIALAFMPLKKLKTK